LVLRFVTPKWLGFLLYIVLVFCDFFTTAGAPGVYNKAVGAGVGVEYEKNGFVARLNYVAQNGDSTESGVFDSSGALNLLAQVGYRSR
jgi:hypothetical protein